jgi:hypothetical protein
MAGLSFAALLGEWMPLPMQTTQNGQSPSKSNKWIIRTDDEANLLIAPRPCLSNAVITVRDSLLDIKPV